MRTPPADEVDAREPALDPVMRHAHDGIKPPLSCRGRYVGTRYRDDTRIALAALRKMAAADRAK